MINNDSVGGPMRGNKEPKETSDNQKKKKITIKILITP